MLSPGTSLGRYVVKRRLAEGGMAEVYLAQAIGPEGFAKDVVIKVVRSFLSSDQQFIDMFINEARLSSRLNHANVVQIFDFGKLDNSYYLAMEYVRGTSLFDLRRRCRERGVPFPPTLVAEIGAQVARGMHYAHTLSDKGRPLGIVHRDVTPHNVLLSFDGAVKLTDFGIAKASTTHTAPGVLKGKFAYMSPEQARGEIVDARTDIFALGVVLWEMLTGSRLFDGDSELAVLRAVGESYIAPPARLNPDVPQELSDIVSKALTRELAGRFQTAFELERALATFVLRGAKSVEDTSVSLFLQQLYREEIEAEERQPQTPLNTPAAQRGVVPQANSFGFSDTLNVDRSEEHSLQRSTVEALPSLQSGVSNLKTDPHTDAAPTIDLRPAAEAKTDRLPPIPPKTDRLPAMRSSARPLAVVESTDVVPTPRPVERKTDPENDPLPAERAGGPVKSSSSQLGAVADVTLPRRAADRDSGRVRLSMQPPGDTTLPPNANDATRAPSLETSRPKLGNEAAPARPNESERVRVSDSMQREMRLPSNSMGLGIDPTLVKRPPPRDELADEPSGPTINTDPEQRQGRSTVMFVVAAVLVALVAGGAVLLGRDTKEDTHVVQVTPTLEPVAKEPPKPLEPVAMLEPAAAIDAGSVLAKVDVPKAVDAPAVVEATPVDAGAPLPEPRVAPTAVKFGAVNVKAIPFATLAIDGVKREITGSQRIKLPLGKHKLVFSHPKRVETKEIVVDGNTVPELVFNANQ